MEGLNTSEDIFASNTTEAGNEAIAEDDFNLYWFWISQIIATKIMALISIITNGICMITVFRLGYLRRSGYFQIFIILALANMSYYFLVFILRGVYTLRYFSLMPGGGVLAHVIGKHPWILLATSDLSNCLLGLHAWLLSVLTVDCRMNFTYYLLNKDGFVKAVRIILATLTFVIAIAGFSSICVLRHGDVQDDNQAIYAVVVTYAIYILIFTILPTFMIVLVGVSNCISFTASSRPRYIVQRLSMKLDRRYNISAIIMLGLMLVHFTRQMSQDIEEKSETHIFASNLVHMAMDIVLLTFPLFTAQVLGSRCCCCPSQHCCHDAEVTGEELKP